MPVGHAFSPAMVALQGLGEKKDLNLFGLYNYLYCFAVMSNGEIKVRDLKLYGTQLAKLSDEEIEEFIGCCIEYEVFVLNDKQTAYLMPEVQAYLKNAEEHKQKRLENSSKGGKISAMKRAEANNPNYAADMESETLMQGSAPQFKNGGNYMPNMDNYTGKRY